LVAQVGDEQAMQGCLSRFESKDWFVRASSLEAFFAVCPSEDPRLLEV
jgi:HEAT repeat protein